MGLIASFCKREEEKVVDLSRLTVIVSDLIQKAIQLEIDRIALGIKNGDTLQEIGVDVVEDLSKNVIQAILDEINAECAECCKDK